MPNAPRAPASGVALVGAAAKLSPPGEAGALEGAGRGFASRGRSTFGAGFRLGSVERPREQNLARPSALLPSGCSLGATPRGAASLRRKSSPYAFTRAAPGGVEGEAWALLVAEDRSRSRRTRTAKLGGSRIRGEACRAAGRRGEPSAMPAPGHLARWSSRTRSLAGGWRRSLPEAPCAVENARFLAREGPSSRRRRSHAWRLIEGRHTGRLARCARRQCQLGERAGALSCSAPPSATPRSLARARVRPRWPAGIRLSMQGRSRSPVPAPPQRSPRAVDTENRMPSASVPRCAPAARASNQLLRLSAEALRGRRGTSRACPGA